MSILKEFGLAKKAGMFGVEIEVEGRGLPNEENIPKGWIIDRGEGSLRDGGLEYVFKKPLNFDESIDKIKQLIKKFEDVGCVPQFGPRTSVHVHVNVQELDKDQALLMYTLSVMLEPLLSRMCGDLREGNNFCLRGIDAEVVFERVGKCIKGNFPVIGENERYGFTNIESLYSFGSIEYRGMCGTLDLKLLKDWLTILGNIREVAVELGNVDAMFQMFSDIGLEPALKELRLIPLAKYLDADMKKERMDLVEEMYDLFSTILIAHHNKMSVPEQKDVPQPMRKVRLPQHMLVEPGAFEIPADFVNPFR